MGIQLVLGNEAEARHRAGLRRLRGQEHRASRRAAEDVGHSGHGARGSGHGACRPSPAAVGGAAGFSSRALRSLFGVVSSAFGGFLEVVSLSTAAECHPEVSSGVLSMRRL